MIVLRELAKAKINFFLHVTGKRPDGYHTLDSLIAFADLGDKVEVTPSEHISLVISGPFMAAVPPEDNSVLRAAEALRAHYKVSAGAALVLHKNLPTGAGLGGGSADAAATLRLLARFWKIKVSPQELHKIAMSLGADVPACLRSTSLYASGIGETLEAGPSLTGLPMVLVSPGMPLLTRDVFTAHKVATSSAPRHPAAFASRDALAQFLRKTKNDLEVTAINLLPEIRTALADLAASRGCLLARMSGSGSTCFGVFNEMQEAQNAAQKIGAAHAGWWVKSTVIQ